MSPDRGSFAAWRGRFASRDGGFPSLNLGKRPDANAPRVDGKGGGGKIGFVEDQIADAARRVAPAAREVCRSEIAGLVHALRPFFARRMAEGHTAFR